jgi:DNA-binding PadR family transcriptional regulator
MVVLKILQARSRGAYGLEIVAASNETVKRGSIYVLLGRLEEKGFVRVLKTRTQTGYDGPPRPQYQLTAEGTRVMTAAEAIGMSFAGARV